MRMWDGVVGGVKAVWKGVRRVSTVAVAGVLGLVATAGAWAQSAIGNEISSLATETQTELVTAAGAVGGIVVLGLAFGFAYRWLRRGARAS